LDAVEHESSKNGKQISYLRAHIGSGIPDYVKHRSGVKWTQLFYQLLMSFVMTLFAKSVIAVSALLAALGWLADGGSVEIDAAKTVQEYDVSVI